MPSIVHDSWLGTAESSRNPPMPCASEQGPRKASPQSPQVLWKGHLREADLGLAVARPGHDVFKHDVREPTICCQPLPGVGASVKSGWSFRSPEVLQSRLVLPSVMHSHVLCVDYMFLSRARHTPTHPTCRLKTRLQDHGWHSLQDCSMCLSLTMAFCFKAFMMELMVKQAAPEPVQSSAKFKVKSFFTSAMPISSACRPLSWLFWRSCCFSCSTDANPIGWED